MKRYGWWLAAFGLAVILVGYYLYFWIPLTTRVDAAERDLRLIEAEVEQARAVHARKDAMEAEIEDIKTFMATMDKRILEATYQPEFLVYLQDIEEAADVFITRIRYGAPQSLEGVYTDLLGELHFMEITLDVVGDYVTTQDFVEEVETGAWFTGSRSFYAYPFVLDDDEIDEEMAEDEESLESIMSSFNFRVYYWPEVMDPFPPDMPEFEGRGRDDLFRSIFEQPVEELEEVEEDEEAAD